MTPPPLPPEREQGGILSDEQLAGIREREAKATPGEWHACAAQEGSEHIVCVCCGICDTGGMGICTFSWDGMGDPKLEWKDVTPEKRREIWADMQFVASARQDVPRLLAHATALARQLQEADAENLALARRVEAAEAELEAVCREALLVLASRHAADGAPAAGEGVGRGE